MSLVKEIKYKRLNTSVKYLFKIFSDIHIIDDFNDFNVYYFVDNEINAYFNYKILQKHLIIDINFLNSISRKYQLSIKEREDLIKECFINYFNYKVLKVSSSMLNFKI